MVAGVATGLDVFPAIEVSSMETSSGWGGIMHSAPRRRSGFGSCSDFGYPGRDFDATPASSDSLVPDAD